MYQTTKQYEESMQRHGFRAEFYERATKQSRESEFTERLRVQNIALAKVIMHGFSMPRWLREMVLEIAELRSVSPFDVVSKRRYRQVVPVRNEVFWRVKDHNPNLSLGKIGRWFGCDHTTIAHALASHQRKTGAKPYTTYNLERMIASAAARRAARRQA